MNKMTEEKIYSIMKIMGWITIGIAIGITICGIIIGG